MPSHLPPSFPSLDAAPLKDVARSLRFVARQGARTLKHSLPIDALPGPAARLVDDALRIGETAGRQVSDFAHALLDRDDPPPPLTDPEAAEAERRFAAAAHDGLRAALRQLGAESALVSETSAQRVWRQVMGHGPLGGEGVTAAALFRGLEHPAILREALWPEDATLTLAEARPVAAFAVLLAMLADPAEFRSRLSAAVDIALALREEIRVADDATALAALFDEFRDHV